MNQRLIFQRLQKEEASIDREPIPNALVTRQGHLNFHFCLYNLEGHYLNGIYHGLLELHQNYPFSAPKLIFYTPSGRFQINLPICTSFTNYHQQSWTSAWNVRSLILATISFMYSEQPSYGCRSDSQQLRRQYARKSKEYNFTHTPNFANLFAQKLVKAKLITEEQLSKFTGNKSQNKVYNLIVNSQSEQDQEIQIRQIVQNNQFPIQQVQQINQRLIEPIKNEQIPPPNRPNGILEVVAKSLVIVSLFGVGCYLIYRFT